jgi:hypothetical protein
MWKKAINRYWLILTKKFLMSSIDSLKEQIEKTEVILAESRENFEKNPDSYSARLLLMSTENYLADLLKELDNLQAQG